MSGSLHHTVQPLEVLEAPVIRAGIVGQERGDFVAKSGLTLLVIRQKPERLNMRPRINRGMENRMENQVF
jgi:hypothetical protein